MLILFFCPKLIPHLIIKCRIGYAGYFLFVQGEKF